jgi:hypothetical protein
MFSVLFSDCAAKLKELLQMADEALEIFNQLAKILKCAELTRDGICDKLLPEVDQQVARWLILASAEVSATFGDGVELLAGLDQLAKIRQSRPIPTACGVFPGSAEVSQGWLGNLPEGGYQPIGALLFR